MGIKLMRNLFRAAVDKISDAAQTLQEYLDKEDSSPSGKDSPDALNLQNIQQVLKAKSIPCSVEDDCIMFEYMSCTMFVTLDEEDPHFAELSLITEVQKEPGDSELEIFHILTQAQAMFDGVKCTLEPSERDDSFVINVAIELDNGIGFFAEHLESYIDILTSSVAFIGLLLQKFEENQEQEAIETPAPKKRGRPAGSKNKPKVTADTEEVVQNTSKAQSETVAEEALAPKKRGRPAGSKNKVKPTTEDEKAMQEASKDLAESVAEDAVAPKKKGRPKKAASDAEVLSRELIQEFLAAYGYTSSVDEDGDILVEDNDITFMISWNEDEPNFVAIRTNAIFSYASNKDKSDAYFLANEITKRVDLVKCMFFGFREENMLFGVWLEIFTTPSHLAKRLNDYIAAVRGANMIIAAKLADD